MSNDIRQQFYTALAQAQGAIEGAKKDVENTFFKSKYADLGAVWDACRDQLSSNGLAILQFPDYDPETKAVSVETIITHSAGFDKSFKTRVPVSKHDAQGVGSAITYARRYALMAAVGIAPEDDDGNAASIKGEAEPAKKLAVNKSTASRNEYSDLQADIDAADSLDALEIWAFERKHRIELLPGDWQDEIRKRYKDKLTALRNAHDDITLQNGDATHVQ